MKSPPRTATSSIWVLLLVLLAFGPSSEARTLGYQGRLTDSGATETPVDGIVPMRFAIWDDPTGGAAVWQEPVSGGLAVTVTDGIFSVALGSVVPLPDSVFDAPARWFEITLHPDTAQEETLAPRQPVGSTPYAVEAGSVEQADLATVADSATNADDASAMDGIAAASWQRAITGGCPAGQFYSSIAADGTVVCATPTETDPQVAMGPDRAAPMWNGSALVDSPILISTDDRVGIGVWPPARDLDVNGQIRIRGGGPLTGEVLVSNLNGRGTWSPQPGPPEDSNFATTEGFIDAAATNGYVDLPIASNPQAIGTGTYLVLATFRYKIETGSGSDEILVSMVADPGACGSRVGGSTMGYIQDADRGKYHTATYHGMFALTESCTYDLILQYKTDGSDDHLYWDDVAITAIRIGD